ncbi:MAG TPA: PASTA domain-containing protein [Chitinophagaceae bacterium]|nr:PASTA domain-containing protein [Chitinophagaceae bacterium]
MFRFITSKSIWVNLFFGFLLMVGCLFLLYIFLAPLTKHGKSKTVPNVVGKSFDEAGKILSDLGFDMEIQDSIYLDTTTKGIVLRQIPEGDAVVKINRKVYLTINRHVPPEVEMPNLIGFSFRNAEMQMKNMGLRIGDTILKPDFAKNSVLEQMYKGVHIIPGTKIQQGSEIVLVLGDGVGSIEFAVPDLLGMTFGQAKSLLESNGLSFLVVLPEPDVTDTLNAFISWQNPPRYSQDGKRLRIRPGQTMDVRLSLLKPVVDSLMQ